MTMITTTFPEARFPKTKNLPCPSCGKKVKRTRTFTATRNPYSNPPNMTRPQMIEHLKPSIEAWEAEPEVCSACMKASEPPPMAYAWPSCPERSGEVIKAMQSVAAVAEKHGLPLGHVDIRPRSKTARRMNPATGKFDVPDSTTVQLSVRGARELVVWCRVLGIDEVRVQRRPGVDTCMWADGDFDGITWSFWGSYDLVLGTGDDVTWGTERGRRTDRGTMTVVAVAALPEQDLVRA